MTHHTKDKGDIAVSQAIADLTMKGYVCFTPVVSEHLPFDLIAYKDGKSIRIQAKYRADGLISHKTVWNDKHGSHVKHYELNDFDYYAIFIPKINKVLYPSINFGGKSISFELPNSAMSFYWWEDFLNFTDQAERKTFRDFEIVLSHRSTPATRDAFASRRKVPVPTKEELEKLIWSKPMTELSKHFGISDKIVAKWIKYYELEKPKTGYWNSHPHISI